MFRIIKSILKSTQKGAMEDPEIAKLKSRHPKIIKWTGNRLNPTYKYGLYVTVGILVAAVSFLFFLGTIQDVIARDPLTLADMRITNLFALYRDPGFSRFMLFITYMGKWQIITLGMVLLSIILFILGKRKYLYALVISVIGGQMLVAVLKDIITRQRPPLANAVVIEKSFSFPSGHTFVVFSFYAIVIYILWKLIKAKAIRIAILILGIGIMFLIPVSRLYLGVHWASDVFGSIFIGISWFSVFATYLVVQDKFSKNKNKKPLIRPKVIRLISIGFIIIWIGFLFFYYNNHSYKEVVASKTENAIQAPINLNDIPDNFFDDLPRTSEGLTGDAIEPIDFIFIGFRGQLDDIFGDAGWVSADSINFFTIWKIAYSSFFNQSYPTAPGTPSFWDSRPNDFSYEKPTSSVRKRQHIHIWKTPYTVNAQPLWVATAHFDRGLKLMNGLMPNHEIDPLIDNERDSLKDQLLKTGKIALLKKVKIVDPVLGQNQAGSIFYTDGKGYIVILKQ